MISTVLLATAALLLADSPPRRLSAEFQNSTSVGGEEFGEVFTNAAALPAGADVREVEMLQHGGNELFDYAQRQALGDDRVVGR